MRIPPPTDWHEFEEIALSALKIKWGSANLTRNGRPGQKQQGVDIYGEDDLGRFVGVQGKLTFARIDMGTVRNEARLAKSFRPNIEALYIVTTLDSDAKLQREIRLFSESRIKRELFPIGVFFWTDLIQELVKNHAEFAKHYPEISVANLVSRPSGARLLSLIDISFYDLNLMNYMGLLFGEMGQMSGEDPHEFLFATSIVESCALVLYEAKAGDALASMTHELGEYCVAYAQGEEKPEGWRPANRLAKLIIQRIVNLEHSLVGKELAVFTLGRALGTWAFDTVNDEPLSPGLERQILHSIRLISPTRNVPRTILRKIQEFKSNSESAYSVGIPDAVYSLSKNLLREREMLSG